MAVKAKASSTRSSKATVKHPPRGGAPAALRASALALFVAKGYHGVGIRELSKAVGLSEAALYRHWKGKQELAIDLFTSHVAEVNALIETAWTGSLDEAVTSAATTMCTLYDERPLVFRFVLMVQHELASLLPDTTRMPMDVLAERIARARAEDAAASDGSGARSDDAMIVSAAVIGIFLQTATYVLYGRIPGPLRAHRDAIVRHVLAVIRA